MYSIKSYGFAQHEIEVLKKQVRLVSSRIQSKWYYQGEGLDANIVLAKKPVAVSSNSKLVLVGVQASEEALPVLEYPIRIMKFLELLESCQPLSQQQSIAVTIAGLMESSGTPDVILQYQGLSIKFSCSAGLIFSEHNSPTDLIAALRQISPEYLVKNQSSIDTSDITWRTSIGRKKLVWSLARSEVEFARSLWQIKTPYKLVSWPRTNEWEPDPKIFKLATLYARQYISIADAAKLCDLNQDQVLTFLHACQICGISVKAKEGEQTLSVNALSEPHSRDKLHWLKKRVRSYFGLSHGH